MRIIQEIPIDIKNQHKLLNLLAEGYKSLSKALMEYVDNSFDSADDFFNSNGLYNHKVEVQITIDRSLRKISIQDNCQGMRLEILKGLANSINDSEKRRREQKRPWVNGQFGLGAHAFRFFAQALVVITKQQNGKQFSIKIDRDNPSAQLIEIEDKKIGSSGTLIEIVDIDKTHLKNLRADELKQEVETYFEMLLRRNVVITIIDNGLQALCTSFNYEEVDGINIQKEIISWKRGSATVNVPVGEGIMVNLKVCTNKIERPPFFSRKGRRINYVAHMESFMRKTLHRKKVWENYYLTGYVEVGDNLEPVMTRDDFLGGKGYALDRSGVYGEIVKLEDEIHNAIETINKDRSDENLRALASVLTDFLSEMAKEDEVQLRYENKEGKENKGEWIKVEQNDDSIDLYQVGRKKGKRKNQGQKIIRANPEKNNDLFGRKVEGEKEGIRIEFRTVQVEAKEKRAIYGDGVIDIFTTHPDFVTRRGNNELEQTRITPRLANYLAAVISSEYKEIFYQQKKLQEQRSSKEILDEQIDFIFRFEEKMKDLINLPIDSIGRIIS